MEKRKIGLAAAGHFVCDINTGALPALIPFLAAAHGYSYSAVTGLMFANSSLASVVQPLFGLMADRRPRRWFLPAGLVFAGCGMAAAGVLQSYILLFFAVMLSGIGSALFHPVAMRFVNACSGERKSTATSLFTVGGNAGFLLAPLLAVAAVGAMGLPGALVLAPLACAMALLLWLSQNERAASSGAAKKHGAEGAHNDWKAFARLMAVVATQSVMLTGLRALAPLYLMDGFGLTKTAAAMSLTVFGIGSIASNIAGGMLSDRFGCRRIIRLGYSLLVPLTVALPFTGSLHIAYALLFLINVVLFLPFSSVVVTGQQYLAKSVGFASGATMGLGVSLGGMFAPCLGWIADTWGLSASLHTLGVCTLIGMTFAWLLPERKGI
ncbi:MAG: MFS transporter [Mailhella sp.]|nr:MFS transporter [Mailhella sp.]